MATLRNTLTAGAGRVYVGSALSADGQVLAVADRAADYSAAMITIYTRAGSTWVSRAVFSGGVDWVSTVSLSADGAVLALGQSLFNYGAGRVLIYDWNGSSYVLRSTVSGASNQSLGAGLSLAPGGDLLLAYSNSPSGWYAYDWTGSVWALTYPTGLVNSAYGAIAADGEFVSYWLDGRLNFYSRTPSGVYSQTGSYQPTAGDWAGTPARAASAPVIATKRWNDVRIYQAVNGVWSAREVVDSADGYGPGASQPVSLSADAGTLIVQTDSLVQTWDLPPVLPPEQPDIYDLACPLIAQVYAQGNIALSLIASIDGLIFLPLIAHVAHTGRIAAPLVAVVRSPRFAVAPSSSAFLADLTRETGDIRLPLVANVWDVYPAGVSGAVAMCSGGVRMCLGGESCNLSALGMYVQSGWSICTVHLPGTGTYPEPIALRLVAYVRPPARVIAELDDYSALWDYQGAGYTSLLDCLDSECGPLLLPLNLSGASLPRPAAGGVVVSGALPALLLESSVGDHYATTEIVFQGQDGVAYNNHRSETFSRQERLSAGLPEAILPLISGYPLSDRVRLSTVERHHLRIETIWGEIDIWPNGLVSLAIWPPGLVSLGSYNGYYATDLGRDRYTEYTLTPRSGRIDTVGRPGFDSPMYTLAADTTVAVSGSPPAAAAGETGDITLPLIARIGYSTATLTLPLILVVAARDPIALPLTAQVFAQGAIALPFIAYVTSPDFAAGGEWDLRVTLSGVDVTPRLLAQSVEIEAEAGMARVARFGLAPNGLPIDMGLSGVAAVEVDYRPPNGAEWFRLFTGRLAEQAIDLATRALTCTATDARTADLDVLTASEIEALTPGGLYSPAVHGADLSGSALAEARMTTLAADLDRSPTGAWRLSPWACAYAPDFALGAAALVDGSLAVQLMRFADVTNRVTVRFQYRYPALRERWARLHWDYSLCDGGFLLAGYQPFWLTSPLIAQAAEQGGWRVGGMVATPYEGQLKAATWWQRTRYAQTVTEDYTLTVASPLSAAAHGARGVGERSASLEAQFDTTAWAAETVTLSPPGGNAAVETVTPVTAQAADGRGAADLSITALLRQARRDILSSLRGGRLTVTLPMNPRIDLPHTLHIEAAGVVAQGRVIRLRHELSGSDGRATTEIELAIYATPGGGTADDALIPPPPPALPASDLTGFAPTLGGEVALDSAPEPDWDAPGFAVQYRTYIQDGATVIETVKSQFAVHLPAVPDADSQPLTLSTAATYPVTVPSDDFVLTH